jgi:hypothetical protein
MAPRGPTGKTRKQLETELADLKTTVSVLQQSKDELDKKFKKLEKENEEFKKKIEALSEELKPTRTLTSDLVKLKKTRTEMEKTESQYASILRDLNAGFLGKVNRLMAENRLSDIYRKIREAEIALLKDKLAKAILDNDETEQESLNNQIKMKELENLFAPFRQLQNVLKVLIESIEKITQEIRKTQQQFGIVAGEAAQLKFGNFVESVKSIASAFLTLGKTVPISLEQIQAAQADFRAQFGGIIKPEDARLLAEEAVRLGLTTSELGKARRVFATQTMGDITSAIEQQEKFISQFEARGLTAKDAMEFIGSNSELLARSGVRFQESMSRAAAEAKRIGVDLSKANQVGDNIIGNFGGFLDSMAELGAMGFGFDAFRLAQVAEMGDTSALFDELRSQLAMTGKDLTNLRRSEQLSLSSAFGMSIEDFQRMAGTLEEPVEQKLQKEGNSFLSKINNKISEFLGKYTESITNFSESIKSVFAGAQWALQLTLLGIIAFNTSKFTNTFKGGVGKKLFPRGTRRGRLATRAAAAYRKIPKFLRSAPKITRGVFAKGLTKLGGGGILSGITGGALGFMKAKNEGRSTTEAVGAGATRGLAAAIGAALGSALGPLGTVIGGMLGDLLGNALASAFPGFSLAMGKFVTGIFEPIKKTFLNIFEPFKTAFAGLKNNFSEITAIFDKMKGRVPSSEMIKLGNLLHFIGQIIGSLLSVGLFPLIVALNAIGAAVSLVSNIIVAIIKLFTGDFKGALFSVGNAFGSLISYFMNVVKAIADLIPGSGWLTKKLQEKKARQMDVQLAPPGYGAQTVTNGTASVATNNADVVVGGILPPTSTGTVDDFISTATGIQKFPKGSLFSDSSQKIDITSLERKLDQLIVLMAEIPSSMKNIEVKMDGAKVGAVISNSESKSRVGGVFRTQRL